MKKTALEHFQDIKELEVADEQGKTVVDILPYKCEQVEKSLKALEILKRNMKVGIDYGNGKDVTASIIGFTNSKGQFIVLANFDDTTKIGKMIIDELDKMRTKSVDDLKDLKTLEIIKEKRVNVGTFIHLTKILKKDYEQCKALNNTFGANICDCDCEFLTEEEYETIKEVLE